MKYIIDRSIVVILTLLIIVVPWGFSDQFVQAQNGQLFVFLIFSVAILLIQTLRLSKSLSPLILNITITDLLVFSLIVLVGIHCFIQNHFSIAFILEGISYILLYITLRRIDNKLNIVLLCSLLIAGIIQATYGNLQLYDIYSSHHSMFKMTGSFSNPGPYSGYLISIIPIAIVLFLLKYTIHLKKQSKNIAGTEIPTPNQSTNNFCSMSKFVPKLLFQRITKTACQNWPNLLQYLIGFSIITILLVLPVSKSRASWLAILGSLLFIIIHMWQKGLLRNITLFEKKWKVPVDKLLKKTIIKITGTITVVVLLIGGLLALYKMKQGSADGRLLIWKVSSQIIKDKPFLGHGINAFEAKYMDYQAKYFIENPASNKSFVADNTKYAFNEFCRIWVEFGIAGIVISILILFFVLFGKASQLNPLEKILLTAIRGALVAIIIFSLFSYPSEIVPIKINLVVLLALASNYLNPIKILRIIPTGFSLKSNYRNQNTFLLNFGRITTTILLFIGGYFFVINGIKLYDANKNWKRAFTTYQMGAHEICIKDYKKAFPYLKYNGDFLLNYGKALSIAEKHKKAIEILEYAKGYYPNTILFTAMGDSYKALGQTDKAEKAYLYAYHMIPSRFYPKYLLAKLYDETGQKEKAVKIAKELLNKKVKIQSTAIEEIREEMRKIISSNSITNL